MNTDRKEKLPSKGKTVATPVQHRAMKQPTPGPSREGNLTNDRPRPLHRMMLPPSRRAYAWLLIGLLAINHLLSTINAQAATVTGTVYQISGNGLRTRIVVTPTNTVLLHGGLGLIGGPATNALVTNAFTFDLLSGDYTVEVQPRRPFTIAVPNTNATYNITSLISSGVLTYNYTNPITSSGSGSTTIVTSNNNTILVTSNTGPVFSVSVNTSNIATVASVQAKLNRTNDFMVSPSGLIRAGIQSGNFQIGNTNGNVPLNYDGTTLTIPSHVATNTIGATVNAITYGLVADGSTDNTVALSNLLNGADSVYLPAGTYVHANPIRVNHPVNAFGDGESSILKYTGSSNSYALTFTAGGSTIRRLNFSYPQAGAAAAGGAISLNAVGFPAVEFCNFNNVAGTPLFVSGDAALYERSNHWSACYNTFSNCFNGITGDGGNRSEYGIVNGNRMYLVQSNGLFLQSANSVVQGNNISGYKGISGVPTSTGLRFISDNTRGHTLIVGNEFAHHKWGMWLEGINGFNGTGMSALSANYFFAGLYQVITNCTFIQINGGAIDGTTEVMLGGNTNCSMTSINISGAAIKGFTNWVVGVGVFTNLVQFPVTASSFTGSGAGLTGIPISGVNGQDSTNAIVAANIANLTNYTRLNESNIFTLWATNTGRFLWTGTSGPGLAIYKTNAGVALSVNVESGSVLIPDGSSISQLNASELTSGTVPNARLINNFTNPVLVSATNAGAFVVSGNQTNLNDLNLTGNRSVKSSSDLYLVGNNVYFQSGSSGVDSSGNLRIVGNGTFIGSGGIKATTTITATNGFISPPLVCTTATTNWSGQGFIVTTTNTTVFMSITGQEGKRFVVSRAPLNVAAGGSATLYITNGSFWSHAGGYVTNWTISPSSGTYAFDVYSTNAIVE